MNEFSILRARIAGRILSSLAMADKLRFDYLSYATVINVESSTARELVEEAVELTDALLDRLGVCDG